MRILAATVLALLPLIGLAGPLDDKTPAYFVDRYGQAKSSKVQSSGSFMYPSRGAVTVKSQFSVREFQDEGLRVYAVFFYPSLKPAAVRLQLDRAWTKEQTDAALAAYGGTWKPVAVAMSWSKLGPPPTTRWQSECLPGSTFNRRRSST